MKTPPLVHVLHTNRRFVVEHLKSHGLEQPVDHIYIRKRNAVTILVIEHGKVWLVRQYRQLVGRECLELPGGAIDTGENPEDAARRELEEETGLRAGRLEHLFSFWPLPSVVTEKVHVYRAEISSRVRPQPEGSERGLVAVRLDIAALPAVLYREVLAAADIAVLQWLLLQNQVKPSSPN